MSKFKVGDKVKIVKGGSGIHHRHVGETTVITSEGFESPFGDGTRYYFDTTGITEHGGHGATESTFELLERTEKPTPANLLTITWQGATITFDPSIAAGEKMVQSIVAMIYKEAA